MDFTILHEIHHFVTVFLWFWGVTLTHHWFRETRMKKIIELVKSIKK